MPEIRWGCGCGWHGTACPVCGCEDGSADGSVAGDGARLATRLGEGQDTGVTGEEEVEEEEEEEAGDWGNPSETEFLAIDAALSLTRQSV